MWWGLWKRRDPTPSNAAVTVSLNQLLPYRNANPMWTILFFERSQRFRFLCNVIYFEMLARACMRLCRLNVLVDADGAPLVASQCPPLHARLPPVTAFNNLPEDIVRTLGLHAGQAGDAEKSVLSEAALHQRQAQGQHLNTQPPRLSAGTALRWLLFCLPGFSCETEPQLPTAETGRECAIHWFPFLPPLTSPLAYQYF